VSASIFRLKRPYPFFETLGSTHPTAQHHILEYLNAQNLKFFKSVVLKDAVKL
jgi:hypothetical protein